MDTPNNNVFYSTVLVTGGSSQYIAYNWVSIIKCLVRMKTDTFYLFIYIVTLPEIYLHPMNKTVRINNDSVRVDFMCKADETLSYYWLKENGSISSTAEGINTSNLLLRNILPSDSGRYQCVAVNENGRSYSNYAMLTIEGDYTIIVIYDNLCMHLIINSSSS